MASFEEDVMCVFDDACVIEALERNEIILDADVTAALRDLDSVIDAVDGLRSVEEIINDPLMEVVREKAKIVLDLIYNSDGKGDTIEMEVWYYYTG